MADGVSSNSGSGKHSESKNTKSPKQQLSDASDKKTATDAPAKSKAELKAERRAKQEAQRAAKSGKKPETSGAFSGGAGSSAQNVKKDLRVPDHLKADDVATQRRVAKKLERQNLPQRTTTLRKVGLFNHLHQYEREVSLTHNIKINSGGLHPEILKLGLKYAEGVICGSNARCIALLGALAKFIADYSTPPQKELARDLEAKLKPMISFLGQCRPLSVSMGNAIRNLKFHITHTPSEMSDQEAKLALFEGINRFLHEKILLAGEAISKTYASTKICNGDVLLVYGYSSLIKKILCDAFDSGTRFTVIVVDGRPKMEGKEMLKRLVRHGIECTYVLINAASYVMQEATKVFLGAHALLANGYVMSRVGSSQVALLAKAYNVPVLVCCETYKFHERVQTDSFVFNELGDPEDLVHIDKKKTFISGWRENESLNILNLMYDVTPPEMVSIVITEIGMIPCTSVPVVLRVMHTESES